MTHKRKRLVSFRNLLTWLKSFWKNRNLLRKCPCGGSIYWNEYKQPKTGGYIMGGAVCDTCGVSFGSTVGRWSDKKVKESWEHNMQIREKMKSRSISKKYYPGMETIKPYQ